MHLVLLETQPLFSNLTFVYFWEMVSHHLHMLPQYHQSHLHLASLFASHLCHLPHILPQVSLIPQLDYHLRRNVSFDTISNDLEVYSIHHLTWVPWRSWAILGNTLVHCLSNHHQTFWDAFGVVHANVGQKLLICYPFKSFLRFPTQDLRHKLLQTQ